MVPDLGLLRISRNIIIGPLYGLEGGMYDYVDQPVKRLSNGSRFILWAMRAWVNHARRGHCGRAAIAVSFGNMGASAALPDFHAAMARLRAAPGQELAFAPLACRRISESEALLLALWADMAGGDHDRARSVLHLIVPAGTADLLVESLSAATNHLRQAQLAPTGLADSFTANEAGGEE